MSKSRKALSIIIPCYNEELSIPKLIDNCLSIINDDIEIIIVDNGSIDDTFKELNKSDIPKNIMPIRIEKNIGYGNGIMSGLNHASGEVLSWTHADLQTDLSDIIRGYTIHKKELLNKTCVIKGERKKRNLFDVFFTFLMGLYCSILLGKWLYDINAQPKIFHRAFLEKFKKAPLDFSLDLYVLYFFSLNKINIKSIPVFFNKRQYGVSKGGGTLKGKFKLIKRTLSYIHHLKKSL